MDAGPEEPTGRGAAAVTAASLPGGSDAQKELLDRLRTGDRAAFTELVDGWSPALLRVARLHVSTHADAEEVVQETWLAVITQLDRFQGRSSLRTWVFRILENRARSRWDREVRSLPWSSAFPDLENPEDGGPTVGPERFRGPGDQWPGGWTVIGRPVPWQPGPEDAAVAAELRTELGAALADLPDQQRTVVELRDVHGLTSDEVCERLDLTPANQRVLLHRGRARLRSRLEDVYRARREEGGVRA
jgi:RNA polymerase sigma-70 factor, ECF subfamily